jgi:hypothetical protein
MFVCECLRQGKICFRGSFFFVGMFTFSFTYFMMVNKIKVVIIMPSYMLFELLILLFFFMTFFLDCFLNLQARNRVNFFKNKVSERASKVCSLPLNIKFLQLRFGLYIISGFSQNFDLKNSVFFKASVFYIFLIS